MPELFILGFAVIALWVMAVAIVGLVVIASPPVTPVKRYPLIILYAAILHYVWAAALLIDPSAGFATSLAGLFWLVGPDRLPYALVAVATLALIYVFFFSIRRLWAALCVLPQQAVLLLSAWTAIEAMRAGHFADGVVRPTAFIVADQAPAVIAAILHATAIVIGYWRPRQTSVAAIG